MLKQRFRERSESWLSASTDRFLVHPPHPPPSSVEPHNPPVSILSHSTTTAAAGQSNAMSTIPVIELPQHPAAGLSQNAQSLQQHQLHDRPRKKLSFRDPEVTSAEAGASSHQPQTHQQQALLKDHGFSDSMENVDLEVLTSHFLCVFREKKGSVVYRIFLLLFASVKHCMNEKKKKERSWRCTSHAPKKIENTGQKCLFLCI